MNLDEHSDSSSEIDVTADSSSASDVTADSSPANGEDDGLLAVVRNVAESASSDVDNSDAGTDGNTDSPTDEQVGVDEQGAKGSTEEDYSDVPFNKHPRFKQLLAERHQFREQVAELEPDANQYRQIQAFMDRAQLSPEEVAEGLILMAEMKSGDPAKAYEALSKKMEVLALASGHKLPPELEERVEQGYVDRETAQQLYRDQMRIAREAATSKTELERRTRQDAVAQAQAVQSAVSAWESQTRSTDPDYSVKADLVKDRLRAHIASKGMPSTPEAAVELAKSAYQEVSDKLAKVRGPKQPMRQPVGGKVNGSVSPQPRNLLEVIQRTVGA